MKDFDIVKYLREHQLGSYGILNHYVDLKPINELGVEQDSMYDPYADEYNHNAMPGTNSVYNAASKKADELEKQAKQAEKMGDPNARQLRLAAAEAREEAFKYAQMFRETDSEEEPIPGGGLEDLVNQDDLVAIKTSVQMIFDDLTDLGFPAEEIERYLVNYVSNAAVPYLLK